MGMTEKEAIKILNQYDVSCFQFYWTDGEKIPSGDTIDAFDAAISALKKQIPQHWQKENRGHVEYTAVCPVCGYGTAWSDAEYFSYCPECGQRLIVEDGEP